MLEMNMNKAAVNSAADAIAPTGDERRDEIRERFLALHPELDARPRPGKYVYANGERSDKTVEAVAHHEAAHAVAVVAFGYHLISANIANGDPVVRMVVGAPFSDKRVILLVGPLTEDMPQRRLYREPDCDLEPAILRSWTDFDEKSLNDHVVFFREARCEHIRSGAPVFFHKELALAAYREAEELAIAFLEIPQHRMAISAVAAALQERGTLNGDEVRQIVGHYINLEKLEAANEQAAA